MSRLTIALLQTFKTPPWRLHAETAQLRPIRYERPKVSLIEQRDCEISAVVHPKGK
jgi:hypothetical protein